MRPFAVPSDSSFLGALSWCMLLDWRWGVANVCTTKVTCPSMAGSVSKEGKECQHWQYVFNSGGHHWVTDYYVTSLSSAAGSVLVPWVIEYSGNQPHVVVTWNKFQLTQPPSTLFTVPVSWNCTFGSQARVMRAPAADDAAVFSRAAARMLGRPAFMGVGVEQCPPSDVSSRT